MTLGLLDSFNGARSGIRCALELVDDELGEECDQRG